MGMAFLDWWEGPVADGGLAKPEPPEPEDQDFRKDVSETESTIPLCAPPRSLLAYRTESRPGAPSSAISRHSASLSVRTSNSAAFLAFDPASAPSTT